MTMDELEKMAKPYVLRGKRHSVRTLHTALNRIAKMEGTSMGFDRDGAVLTDRCGVEKHFRRTFDASGDSIIHA